jgi:hypothetical protein
MSRQVTLGAARARLRMTRQNVEELRPSSTMPTV